MHTNKGREESYGRGKVLIWPRCSFCVANSFFLTLCLIWGAAAVCGACVFLNSRSLRLGHDSLFLPLVTYFSSPHFPPPSYPWDHFSYPGFPSWVNSWRPRCLPPVHRVPICPTGRSSLVTDSSQCSLALSSASGQKDFSKQVSSTTLPCLSSPWQYTSGFLTGPGFWEV